MEFIKSKRLSLRVFSEFSVSQVQEQVFLEVGLNSQQYYLLSNGKLLQNDVIPLNQIIHIIPRTCGGKGGFGSMLRAIGAQIEKTTNREACRDLSGRRLRDINEEKRLKKWISNQADREKEAKARKQKKLEKLCETPRHEFNDEEYDKERQSLPEKVEDAVLKGLEASASCSGVSGKRKIAEKPVASKKRKLWGGNDWPRDSTKVLIKLYKQYPNLYLSKSPDYNNRRARQKSLQEIVKRFNRRQLTHLTTHEVRKKIHGLRTQFIAEIQKMKKSEESDTDTYKTKWWCFKELQFLQQDGEENLDSTTESDVILVSDSTLEPEIIYNGDESASSETKMGVSSVYRAASPNPSRDGSEKVQSPRKGWLDWPREATKLLIELYEQYPFLYVTKSPYYSNRHARQRAMDQLVERFNKKRQTNITVDEVKKKIHNLRTQYLAEKKKSEASDTDPPYKPKLWCFEDLHFLQRGSEGKTNLPIEPEVTLEMLREVDVKTEMLAEAEIKQETLTENNLEPEIFNGDMTASSEIKMEVESPYREVSPDPSHDGSDPGRSSRKSGLDWPREATRLLIKLYEKYPNLYLSKSPDYNNRLIRQKTMEQLVKRFNKIRQTNVTVDEVRKKIHNFRSQYLVERKKMEASDFPYKPRLWCYDDLYFLEQAGAGKSNLPTDADDILDSSAEEKAEILGDAHMGLEMSPRAYVTSEIPPGTGDGLQMELENVSDGELSLSNSIDPSQLDDLNGALSRDGSENVQSSRRSCIDWPREATRLLIKLYEKYPNLYLPKSPNYHNRLVRQKMMDQLVERFNKIRQTNVTVDEVRKKIHNFRSQYLVERKKMEASETYKPRLWCYDDLHFLQPGGAGRSNLSLEDDEPLEPLTEIEVNAEMLMDTNMALEMSPEAAEIPLETADPLQVKLELNFDRELRVLSQEEFMKVQSVPFRKGGIEWTREATGVLIKLYQRHPCLYTPKHPDYHVRNVRFAAFEEIVKEFNTRQLTPYVTREDVKKKIHSLRTQYLAEIQKIKKSEEAEFPYTPKLWCFNDLYFIQQGTSLVEPAVNLAQESNEKEEVSESPLEPEILFEESVSVSYDTDAYSPGSRTPSLNGYSSRTPSLNESDDDPPPLRKHHVFADLIAEEMEVLEDEDVIDDLKGKILMAVYEAKKQQRLKNLLKDSNKQ